MRLPLGLTPLRLVFIALGFTPIAALCISLFELVPLPVSSRYWVLPAVALTLALGFRYPKEGRLALIGFLAGVVATGAYDVTRLLFVWTGLWPDFIPPIGRIATTDAQASPIWGYMWRFIGNGGGMGMAFAMLPRFGTRWGTAYGTAIWACLIITLLFAPNAQATMFQLNVYTFIVSLVGHWDYGAVLGYLTRRWAGPLEHEASLTVPQAAPEAVEAPAPRPGPEASV